jgi:hypothetical protein
MSLDTLFDAPATGSTWKTQYERFVIADDRNRPVFRFLRPTALFVEPNANAERAAGRTPNGIRSTNTVGRTA